MTWSGEEWLEPHTPMPPRGADDAETELAGGDTLDDRVRVRDAEEDAHVRMFTMELAEEYRNDDRRRPGGRPQGDRRRVSSDVAATSETSCSSSASIR